MGSSSHPSQPVPLSLCLAYGAPALALAAVGVTFYVFLPKFYADVAGVNLGALGGVILGSRVWDALTDPWIGRLSDRTRTRWGRRRPWLAAAVVPLVLALALLLAPPAGLGPAAAAAWLGLGSFLFFLFWTAVAVPYEALGPELSADYDERTRLLGTREAGVVAGTIVAALLPLAAARLAGAGAGERQIFAWLAVLLAGLLVATVLLFLGRVRERALAASQRPHAPLRASLVSLWGNRPFRVLLAAYMVSAFGAQLPATLILFYVEHVLGSARGPLFLLLYLGVGFLFFPLWIRLARRFEKRAVLVAAMAVNTGAFLGVLTLGRGDTAAYAVLVACSAVGLGGVVALPPSMQADVIDLDEEESGVRREGEFIGVWSVARKLAAALGAGLAFPLLAVAGYVQAAGVTQPPAAFWTLRLLYAGVPCLCNVAAAGILLRYRVTREQHDAVRRRIGERLARAALAGERQP